MTRFLITYFLAACVCCGEFYDLNAGRVLRDHQLPNPLGRTYDPTIAMYEAAGIVTAIPVPVVTVTTSSIPAGIKVVATAYRTMIEQFRGPGAATNTANTLEDVMLQIAVQVALGNTNITADIKTDFRGYHEVMRSYMQGLPVAIFPFYDMSDRVETNTRLEWKPITSEGGE